MEERASGINGRGHGRSTRNEPVLTIDTGDNLHFGLARLMAQSAGLKNIELVVVGDDVSVPRSRGNMVGRRCLAGITLGTLLLEPCVLFPTPYRD